MLNYYRVFEKYRVFLSKLSLEYVLPFNKYYIYLFVAQMIRENVAVCSIRSALSAISWLHRINNLQDPTTDLFMKKVLIGVNKYRQPKPELSPLGRDILHVICELSYKIIPSQYEQVLIRAILLLMYHACLRVGEAVKSASVEHSLKLVNVEISYEPKPVATILLHSFKHAKSPKRFTLNSSDNPLYCPVRALIQYISVRIEGNDTLFNDVRGRTATRKFVADKLKLLVLHAGLDPSRYNTHSIRIGRTTDLAKAGVPEAIIKQTGRWDSDAYKRYIRFPAFTLPQ